MRKKFSEDEQIRYARQIILPQIGLTGQLKLKNSRVLIVGAGGLGSSPAIYLTAAGVGTIGLIDADKVDLSNLHRQILHYTKDIDKPKVISAQEKLEQINPRVIIKPCLEKLTVHNAPSILAEYDLIIDGTDNIPSRYLINDACFFQKKPFVYGGVYQFEGQVSVFAPNGPCYRCFFSEPPPQDETPSCADAGVIGVIPGIIGLLQANEAIKWICQIGETLKGRLLLLDALATQFRELKIRKDPECLLCGISPTIRTLNETHWTCKTRIPLQDQSSHEISVKELKQRRDKDPSLYVLDVREENEWNIARINGAHLKPLSTLENDFEDIPKDKEIYCLCKVGSRSAKAIQFLKSRGYHKLFLIKGGIQAWSKEIDPTVKQY